MCVPQVWRPQDLSLFVNATQIAWANARERTAPPCIRSWKTEESREKWESESAKRKSLSVHMSKALDMNRDKSSGENQKGVCYSCSTHLEKRLVKDFWMSDGFVENLVFLIPGKEVSWSNESVLSKSCHVEREEVEQSAWIRRMKWALSALSFACWSEEWGTSWEWMRDVLRRMAERQDLL